MIFSRSTVATHRFLTCALLLALHGCHGLVTTARRQPALGSTSACRNDGHRSYLATLIALLAFAIRFARCCERCWLVRRWTDAAHGLSAAGAAATRAASSAARLPLLLLRFRLRTLCALLLFFFFRFYLGATTLAIFCARFLFGFTRAASSVSRAFAA